MANVVHIFRVEGEDGKGPYQSSKGILLPDKACRNHPGPWEDGEVLSAAWRGGGYGKLHFGFSSRRQLLAWFPKEDRIKLKQWGFVVREYRAVREVVFKGGKQVAFVRDRAKPVRVLDICEEDTHGRVISKAS